MKTQLEELDELAGKFIIGHKRLSKRQKEILERIEKLRRDEKILENRIVRVKNLINVLYGYLAKHPPKAEGGRGL